MTLSGQKEFIKPPQPVAKKTQLLQKRAPVTPAPVSTVSGFRVIKVGSKKAIQEKGTKHFSARRPGKPFFHKRKKHR